MGLPSLRFHSISTSLIPPRPGSADLAQLGGACPFQDAPATEMTLLILLEVAFLSVAERQSDSESHNS